jgi:uncharacterized protein
MMDSSPKYAAAHLEQARLFLEDADFLLKNRRYTSSVDRAYYAMFHAAQAFLVFIGTNLPRSHHGLLTLFGRDVVQKGLMDKAIALGLNAAFRLRQASTYEIQETRVSQEDATSCVEAARIFIDTVENTINRAS